MLFYCRCITILFIAFVIGLSSCKEDCPCMDATNPDCENYDPCYGKRTINTLFRVRPGDRGFPAPEEWCDLVQSDTLSASSVRFDAPIGNPENSTYTWQIGTEADIRKGKSLEVDFSDYLNDSNWESHIPITLTIRTPMNDCLESEDETVKTVTRELFFTMKSHILMEPNINSVSYRGFLVDNPNDEVGLELINLKQGIFRGIRAPVFFTVGLPNIDTLLFPSNCLSDFCANYVHTKYRFLLPDDCETANSRFLFEHDFIFLDGIQKIKRVWLFKKPEGFERIEFIGERIE